MLYLVAKLMLAGLPPVLLPSPQSSVPPTFSADATWEQVRDSVALVRVGSRNAGVAVLIDSRGYMLTGDLSQDAVILEFQDGKLSPANVLTRDDVTRLVLLVVPSEMVLGRPAITLSTLLSSGPVLAATPNGPIRGTQVVGRRVGIVGPENRFLPLTEYQFEASPNANGYVPIFNASGNLVGLLGSAYENVGAAQASGAGNFGPVGLNVGYSVSPKTLERVIDGFLSDTHQVNHPTIGAFFKASPDGEGALITSVAPNSPAFRGGLQAGMIVIAVDGQVVGNSIDLASILFERAVGDVIEVTVRDVGTKKTLRITVGADGSE
ncbi:MAG: serine protease [Fimbriimonadaceae bacterium]|nr:serine protease [Fimbriimonadaceae bacterium]